VSRIKKITGVALFVFGALSSARLAAAPVSIDGGGFFGSVGRAVGFTASVTTRPYEGIDAQAALLPFVLYQRGKFFISGLNPGYFLRAARNYELSLIATPRFFGFSSDDSPVLANLSDRDYSVHGGVQLRFNVGDFALSTQLVTDLLGESSGTEIIASVGRSFTFGQLSLTPSFGLNLQDGNLIDHYYGVSASESDASGFAQFDGGTTLSSSLTLTGSYRLQDSWTGLAALRADFYGDDISSSPLVDEDATIALSVGAIYSF